MLSRETRLCACCSSLVKYALVLQLFVVCRFEDSSIMPEEPAHLVGLQKKCPRCQCSNLKFLFYNNRSVLQPRYKCLGCLKDFTLGGRLHRRDAQQSQQHLVWGIQSQGTTEAARGEAGPSDRTRVVREISGVDGISVRSEVRRSDRLATTPTEVQVVLPQNPTATAFPLDGETGVVVNELQTISGEAAKPVAIPRFGDEAIVEGAANIWVKAVLGSAPFGLTRLRHPSPKNNRTTSRSELP